MDILRITGRTVGDPFPQYSRRDEVTGAPGAPLPPGTSPGQTFYWNGATWGPNDEVTIDATGHIVSISNAFIAGGSECTGGWLLHGAGDLKLEIAKVGPGARIFGVHTDTDTIDLFGALQLKRVSVSSSPYTVAARDNYLAVNTNAARTINLPAASAGERLLTVGDVAGTGAVVNNITLARNGADTINLVAANYTIAVTRSSRMLYSDGVSNWEVIGGLL